MAVAPGLGDKTDWCALGLTGHSRRAAFADCGALRLAVFALATLIAMAFVLAPAPSRAETRTLKVYNTHTGERDRITFKRNGRYVQSGLRALNHFLRDHRRNEPTRMDPELFDLVWEVYQAADASAYIHVVSGYRSPATNEMLRRTRGGQARKSQHTLGKAIDFFIPGVSTRKLRELGFKLQGGGVGYYPKSGTPYVHLDTGSVRAWPRMSRPELARLFPDGRTLHVPPDGRRLPGYQQALAAYNARKRSGQSPTFERSRGGNLFANLLGGDRDRSDGSARSTPRPSTQSPRQARQDTPATVLAALPSRSMPRPDVAPRTGAGQGVVAARIPTPRATIPVAQTPPAPVPTPQAAPTPIPAPEPQSGPAAGPGILLAELTPPVPRARPAVPAPVAAEAATELALAVPLPAPAPRAASRRDGQTSDTPPTLVAAYAPSSRPAVEPMVPPAADLTASTQPGPADGRGGRIALPAPRPERFKEAIVTAALDTGVRTTAKTARASARNALAGRPAAAPVAPAGRLDPARFGDRTVSLAPLTTTGRPTERPQFIRNATRAAPEAVYTAGFSKAPPPDPNRFSGSAVTFLAVARFGEAAGGDGHPLRLRIPASN